MLSQHLRSYSLLDRITIIPAFLLASFFLMMGLSALISPNVLEEALPENTLVGASFILTAAVLVYALFRPYSGGFFLCIWAVLFTGLMMVSLRSTQFGTQLRFVFYLDPFWGAVAGLVLLLGVLSVIRGRLSRRTASEDPEQAS